MSFLGHSLAQQLDTCSVKHYMAYVNQTERTATLLTRNQATIGVFKANIAHEANQGRRRRETYRPKTQGYRVTRYFPEVRRLTTRTIQFSTSPVRHPWPC